MQKNRYRFKTFIIMLSLIMSVQTFAATGINLFILSFDNYQNDPEIDWLREGFVDFLMDYFRSNPDVNVQRTTAINATLDKIRRTPDLQTARNYILTGNFQRVNDQFEVTLQLTDINTWKTTEQQKIVEKTTDLAKVIEVVNQSAAGLIDPTLRPIGKVDAESSVRLEQEMEPFRETTAATKKIEFALDKLSGIYSEKPKISVQPQKPLAQQPNEGINAADFSRRLNESVAQSSSFAEILRRICSNPYKIEISDPEFSRVTLNDEMIKISFVVRYTLNRELIDEMLSTFSYNSKETNERYTEYIFNGDRFIISENLLRLIAQGEFRNYPVISFQTGDGSTAYMLIDVPVSFSKNVKPSPKIKFVSFYQPSLNLIASVKSVRVQLNNKNSEVRYEVEIRRDDLANISQMNIIFLSESGLLDLLKACD